jgi:hypothetical protein
MRMDWMTLAIEIVGLLILGIWIVIPLQEFKQIVAKIRKDEREKQRQSESPDAGAGGEGR